MNDLKEDNFVASSLRAQLCFFGGPLGGLSAFLKST